MTRLVAALIAGAVLATSVAVVETAAGGAKLSKKAALKKTAKVARKAARKQRNQGAVAYFAFGCKRKSRTVVNCIGGVGYSDNSACIQRVRNRRRGGRVVARRFGRILCGDLPQEAQGGGGGESTAICAIRQSVCI
jgi:hypothetical protein